jgi:hypothetical protein
LFLGVISIAARARPSRELRTSTGAASRQRGWQAQPAEGYSSQPKGKTLLRERSSGLRRAQPGKERLVASAPSWRLALSALELVDLGLQALKFQALQFKPLRLAQFGFTLFDLQAMRFKAFLAPTLPL